MAEKLIITFDQYTKIVEKLAIEIHNNYKPTVLVGIMRGAAPILDILSRILKLPIAYIVIQSYSGKGMEDKQGQLMFAREISSLAENKDFDKVLLVDDLSDTGLTLNKSIEWLKKYEPGEAFGELALLYNAPRAATITSDNDSVLYALDRQTFNHIVKDAAIRKRDKYESFLKSVELLKSMDDYERS